MGRHTFRYEAILYLTGPDFSALAESGGCPWTYPPMQRNGRSWFGPTPGPDEPCLALDGSRSHYFMEFEPRKDLELLLDASQVVLYQDATNGLTATGDGSLRGLIERRCASSVGPSSGIILSPGGMDPYRNVITGDAVAAWNAEGRLFGQLACCSCGVAGCGATYAWIERTQGRLLVEVSAAGPRAIEVGPFTAERPPPVASGRVAGAPDES